MDRQQSAMIQWINPKELKAHDFNKEIYGDDSHKDLIESIKELGVLQAVYCLNNKTIISGHRRWRAAIDAGIENIPVLFIDIKDDSEIKRYIIEHNRYRNKTGLQLYKEGIALEEIESKKAKERQGNRTDLNIPPNLAECRDTRDIVAETIGISHGQWDNLKKIAEQKPELLIEIKPGGKSINSVMDNIRRKNKENDRNNKINELLKSDKKLPNNIQLITGDLKEEYQKLEKESINVILTDPPYGKEYIYLYDILGQASEYLLKPDGYLLVMTGQSYIPEYNNILSKYLTYWWTIAYMTPGDATMLWQRYFRTNWKPVFMYVKNDVKEWHTDVVNSLMKDKRFMEWGQSETGFAELILNYTKENDVILDPFLGAGTTGLCANRLNRRFIGIDINSQNVAIAKGRIANDETGNNRL